MRPTNWHDLSSLRTVLTMKLRRSTAVLVVLTLGISYSLVSTSIAAPARVSTAADLLAEINVVAEPYRTGYSRDLFTHWVDADGDGCDTRREVLVAEALVTPKNCFSDTGSWFSIYDSVTTKNAQKFDVDHVVALAEAWDSGAATWTASRREAFANDLDSPWSLVAVTASSNRTKSDKDISNWKPTKKAGRCFLATATVITKWRWSLSVDQMEFATLKAELANCPSTQHALPSQLETPPSLPVKPGKVRTTADPTPKPKPTASPKPSTPPATPSSPKPSTPPAIPASPKPSPSGSATPPPPGDPYWSRPVIDPVAGKCPKPWDTKGTVEGTAKTYYETKLASYEAVVPRACFLNAAEAIKLGFKAATK